MTEAFTVIIIFKEEIFWMRKEIFFELILYTNQSWVEFVDCGKININVKTQISLQITNQTKRS